MRGLPGAVLAVLAGLHGCAAIAGTPPMLSGQWVQGGLVVGKAAPGSQVTFNGRALRVSPDGDFVIGLDRDEQSAAEIVLRRPDGSRSRYEYQVAKREYVIQRIDGLPPDKVTPPPEALKRIEQENARAAAARRRDTARVDFLQDFVWPCIGRISGIYGSQRILNGEPKRPHFGVDVAVPVGTKIRAPAGGIVSLAETDMYFNGGTLMIDHGQGLTSSFMHLSRLLVKVGDEVKQGDVVAQSGMTGRATGPHLHWGVTWFDAKVDAQLLAGPMPPD